MGLSTGSAVRRQWEGCYELSVGNADKGLLPIEEIRRRVEPFVTENLPLVLTQVSTDRRVLIERPNGDYGPLDLLACALLHALCPREVRSAALGTSYCFSHNC